MSTTYTPTSTGALVLSYTMPADGDAPDAASVKVPLEGLADDASRLALGGDVTTVTGRSIPFVWTGLTETAPGYSWTFGSQGQANQSGTASALTLVVHLNDIPNGATVTRVDLVIDPANGHAGAGAGLTFPTLKFWKLNVSTGVATQIGSTATDAWNAGSYESIHPLIVSGLTEAIDWDTYRYVLEFTAEAGANYLAGLSVKGPLWSGSARKLRRI